MLEVVVQILAADGRRGTRNGVGSEVAVDLLRPVADVGGHVRPEGRVGEPALQRVLVDGEVARPLSEADHEDGSARRPGPVAFVEPAEEFADVRAGVPVAAAHCRRELVQHPAVAARHVVARLGHALPRGHAGRVPGRPGARDPAAPRREVDLGHRMEVRAERSDARRLVTAERRLVRDERWHRHVVVGARRGRRGELRREAEPVGGRVEDAAQRPARRRLRRGSRVHEAASSLRQSASVAAGSSDATGASGGSSAATPTLAAPARRQAREEGEKRGESEAGAHGAST